MTSIVRTPRVLVFDSGVGGLSVLHEIQRRLPVCEFIYASDNEAFPYGIKSEDELITRVDKVLRQILASHPVDIIVIACNTASTVALPHIRNHFAQPIVGVVPAIKPAELLAYLRHRERLAALIPMT
jgi:glutamate racemase